MSQYQFLTRNKPNGILVLTMEALEKIKKMIAAVIAVIGLSVNVVTVHAEPKYDEYGNWVETTAEWVPYYSQANGWWANQSIGEGGTFRNTGCVPTVGAMILKYHGYDVTPYDVGWMMYEAGHYNSWYGHGTDTGVWSAIAANYGLGYWNYMSRDDIFYALKEGMLVTACIQYGRGSTHCVLLAGLDQEGRTTVFDPIAGKYTAYVDNIIAKQSTDWVDLVDGGPFIALYRTW